MIKRFNVRIMTVLLASCIMLTGVIPSVTQTAEAKSSPKLSSKSIILVKGGAKTIKLKSGKGSWTIEGNGVAKLKAKKKKSVTVVPLKAGDTVVTCKAGGKQLKCKVKVLNNAIGSPKENKLNFFFVGKTMTYSIPIPNGATVNGITCTSSDTSTNYSVRYDKDEERNVLELKIKTSVPGRFDLTIDYEGAPDSVNRMFAIMNFRGKAKVKKTKANYNKWRRQFLLTTASTDMTTWEIIHSVGLLISQGKYSMKGGVSGMQLWYGGNGTCVSGARMMQDFTKDVGVKNKVRFAGNMKGPVDIYGLSIMYGIQHRNVRIKLDGSIYELNPQPGAPWPIGIVKRSKL